MVSPLGQRLAQSLVVALGDRIPGLVATRVGGDTARLGEGLGIGALLAMMGLL